MAVSCSGPVGMMILLVSDNRTIFLQCRVYFMYLINNKYISFILTTTELYLLSMHVRGRGGHFDCHFALCR